MKAFALEGSGKPARIMDIPKPEVRAADALVKVKAASVNGFDVYQAMGGLTAMMEHAFPTTIGRDFAGVIESVGPDFRDFAVGDEVFGFIPAMPPLKSGSFADYVGGGPSPVLARKPAGLGFGEAAGLTLVGVAALDLLDAVGVGKGDVVLIVGATGGIGSLAVQIAAARGATVVATALPDQEEYVRDLGAADTIDYSAGSVVDAVRSRYPGGISALIDVVSQKEAFIELSMLVRSGGNAATVMGAADVDALAALGVGGTNVAASPTPEKLRFLADLATSGKLRVPIDSSFPIDRADDALKAFQRGTRGKVILTF